MGLFSTIGTALGSAFGGPIGGTIGTAIGSHLDTSSAQKAERAATDRANALSISQANTGYQRAMADMKAAGLNPILAAKYGPAPVANIQRENILTPQMMTAEASVMQAHTAQQQMQSNVRKIDSEIEKIAADIGLTKQQTEVAKQTVNKIVQDIEVIKQQIGIKKAEEQKKSIIGNLIDEYNLPEKMGELGRAADKVDKELNKLLNKTWQWISPDPNQP